MRPKPRRIVRAGLLRLDREDACGHASSIGGYRAEALHLDAERAVIMPEHGLLAQTVVPVPAGVSTLIVAGARRDYLGIQNISTGRANLAFTSPAVVDSGIALDPASEAGGQGGAFVWDAQMIPTNAVYAYSALGTTLVVLVG